MNDHKDEHPHPNYRKIYFQLLILLVISIWGPIFAGNIESRFAMISVVLLTAFGVGIIKASMVGAWFMHLNVEVKVLRCLLVVCIAFLMILFAGTAPEVLQFKGQHREADPDPIYEYPKKDKKAQVHE
tara:strand:- start:583 stop:966 length:384 start_codon:yes stop_codon:yes gene_type:complete